VTGSNYQNMQESIVNQDQENAPKRHNSISDQPILSQAIAQQNHYQQ